MYAFQPFRCNRSLNKSKIRKTFLNQPVHSNTILRPIDKLFYSVFVFFVLVTVRRDATVVQPELCRIAKHLETTAHLEASESSAKKYM